MKRAASVVLLALGVGCHAAAAPAVSHASAGTAKETLPDDGPRTCLAQAVARVRNALPERELPIRTSGIVYGPERACILDDQPLDYLALPILDTPSPYPLSAGTESSVHSPRLPGPVSSLLPSAEVVASDGPGRRPDAMQLLYGSGRPSSAHPWTVAGTAPAIVPSTLYAFRYCSWGCTPDDRRPRVEVLVVVGPRAVWTSSSDDDGGLVPELGRLSPFSFVSAAIWEGSSGTLGFVVAPESLVSFGAMNESDIDRALPGPQDVARYAAYTIDVVWPRDGTPDLTLHRGEVIGPSYR